VRRKAKSDVIPEDLLTFDPQRWIRDALDHGDWFLAPRLLGLTEDELLADGYMVRILCAARYRQAPWDSVGQRAADRHYYALSPHPGLWPLVPVQ
jgi:hypothetical protein